MLLRKHAWAALAFLLLGPLSVAQNAPKADVSLGYSLVKSVQGINLTANGVTGSVEWNITNWLGAVGDFGVYHGSPISVGLTAETYTVGPRFFYRRWERFTPFAQVLLGGIHAAAVAGSLSGATNEFGGGAGGGVDIALDNGGKFALRRNWNTLPAVPIRTNQARFEFRSASCTASAGSSLDGGG